eukprot:7753505-Prorocentrum_lima.AAC.1
MQEVIKGGLLFVHGESSAGEGPLVLSFEVDSAGSLERMAVRSREWMLNHPDFDSYAYCQGFGDAVFTWMLCSEDDVHAIVSHDDLDIAGAMGADLLLYFMIGWGCGFLEGDWWVPHLARLTFAVGELPVPVEVSKTRVEMAAVLASGVKRQARFAMTVVAGAEGEEIEKVVERVVLASALVERARNACD